MYFVKLVRRNRSQRVYPPCDGYTVTQLPEEGMYFNEHHDLIGLPEDVIVKLELSLGTEVKDTVMVKRGEIAYITIDSPSGKTVDSYPRKSERAKSQKELRVLEEEAHG